MKLVGDSKFIAEAYQKIYEDDFMAGMSEYEDKAKNTIYVWSDYYTMNNDTPNGIKEIQIQDFPDIVKREYNGSFKKNIGFEFDEFKKRIAAGEVLIATGDGEYVISNDLNKTLKGVNSLHAYWNADNELDVAEDDALRANELEDDL